MNRLSSRCAAENIAVELRFCVAGLRRAKILSRGCPIAPDIERLLEVADATLRRAEADDLREGRAEFGRTRC